MHTWQLVKRRRYQGFATGLGDSTLLFFDAESTGGLLRMIGGRVLDFDVNVVLSSPDENFVCFYFCFQSGSETISVPL